MFRSHRCNCWRVSQARQSSLVLNLASLVLNLAFDGLALSGEMQQLPPAPASVVGLPPAVGLVLALAGAVIWACADASWTARINIAASTDLMTNPVEVIEAAIMKHICLVSNNRERFMGTRGRDDVERR